jgi:hypothetical protein
MKAWKWSASYFECLISSSRMYKGGITTNISSGSRTTHLTSLGMRYGCVAKMTAKKCLVSSLFTEAKAGSKLRRAYPVIT